MANHGRYERELVSALDECGYVAMRAPSSGSATDRDLPDLLAGRARSWNDHLDPIAEAFLVNRSHTNAIEAAQAIGRVSAPLAIEHKSTSATTAYADEAEVEALVRFAEAFGAVPLVGARFKTQAAGKYHYLVEPSECRRTQGDDAGNYGVPKADASERASFVVDASGPTFLETDG